jgi:pimeloyl-ACP methyl ester carboxylesterase
MKRALTLTVFVLLFLLPAFSTKANADAQDKTIASRTAEVDGARLHYMTAGHGTPLILLHGYAETSLMWKPIIPALAERFTVIAPDLPGIGDSDIPANGLDMKSAAVRIHDLAKSLGVQKAEVVGHDIGLMVAYAYAAQFPTEVTKLVLMDAFLPGVAGWEAVYNNPAYGISASTGRPPKPWFRVASVPTSIISGTISPPTRLIPFQKRIAEPTLRLTHGQDACMRRGLLRFIPASR